MIEFPSLSLTAPEGSIIGILQEGGSVEFTPAGIGANDEIIPAEALSKLDAIQKKQLVSRLVQQRRGGATFVLLTHDEPLLESCADEIWWLRDGKLVGRGDPIEVLAHYRRHVAQALRETGRNRESPIAPALYAMEMAAPNSPLSNFSAPTARPQSFFEAEKPQLSVSPSASPAK